MNEKLMNLQNATENINIQNKDKKTIYFNISYNQICVIDQICITLCIIKKQTDLKPTVIQRLKDANMTDKNKLVMIKAIF